MLVIRRQCGVSVVELLIGIAIASLLFSMGVPAFTLWLQNTQNRTAAESIVSGLQLARIESVKRNVPVRFDLTDAGGLVAWNVGCVTVTADCPATIQRREAAESTTNARVGVSAAVIPIPAPAGYFSSAIAPGSGLEAGVTFNGMGQVSSGSGDDITRIDITNAVSAEARRYVVTVGTGGQVRMCDPTLDFSINSQGCS